MTERVESRLRFVHRLNRDIPALPGEPPAPTLPAQEYRHSVVMGHLPSHNCKVISLTLMLGGSMLTRRRIFVGGVASVICAPAIVRAESLMPIQALIVPMQPIHAGFVERLRFHWMEQVLKNGWTTERATTFGGISENEARRQVTYARMHGLLASGTDPA
jgi:hypothetical protein